MKCINLFMMIILLALTIEVKECIGHGILDQNLELAMLDITKKDPITKQMRCCQKKMQADCGLEFRHSVVDGIKTCKRCCKQLLDLGDECSDFLDEMILHHPEYKKKKDLIVKRSKLLAKQCSEALALDSSLPPSS